MGFITAERGQRDIIGFSIDDFVEEDSKCRYIVRLIDSLDLRELYSNYKGQGAESYDPKIMLAIWFLAYSEGVSSSREIEKLRHKHLDFIYISANLRPDHSTLCRFMQRNGELWPKYFMQMVELGKKMKISDFREVMIDGTKMKSKASKKQSMRERKITRYLEAVKKDIEEYKAKLNLQEKEETPAEDISSEKTSSEELEKIKKKLLRLEKTEKLLVVSKDELVERKQILKSHDSKKREGHQINLQEPEAMMMDLALGQGYHPGYNAQIAVDSKTQFIVSCSLTQDRNDQRQFSVMHEMTEHTLGSNKSRVYGADSGYNTFDQLEYMDINNVNAYVRDPMLKNLRRETRSELLQSKRKLYHIDFIYDKDSDSYTCPAGEKLLPSKSRQEKSSKKKKYNRKDCSGCPLFSQCLGEDSKRKGKEIEGDLREYLAEAMRLKMQSVEAEEIMMKRQTTVEPVFGYMKETLGFRRFRTKGLMNAASEFAFICMAVNINKLFRLHGSFKGLFYKDFITSIYP